MYIVTSGMNPNEDHICHYGRKGMRWGQHLFARAMLGPTTHYAVSKELQAQAKKRGYNSYEEWAKADKKQMQLNKANKLYQKAVKNSAKHGDKAFKKYNKYGDKIVNQARSNEKDKYYQNRMMARYERDEGSDRKMKKYWNESNKHLENWNKLDATHAKITEAKYEINLGRDYVSEILNKNYLD